MRRELDELFAGVERSPLVVAEVGINHNGDMALAEKLIDAAIAAGCSACKFQAYKTDQVYIGEKADEMRQYELSPDQLWKLKFYCDKRGIEFFATPDEMDSAELLLRMGVRIMKVGSQDVTNLPFLSALGALCKRHDVPVLYSTGACSYVEMMTGFDALRLNVRNIVVMHCVSAYPAPHPQTNMLTVRYEEFHAIRGFSDHCEITLPAVVALALGARVFEKHITLARSMPGPDHAASMSPGEMREYVRTLSDAWLCLGDGRKRVMPCEEPNLPVLRRYLVARHPLPADAIVTERDVLFKKTGFGIPAAMLSSVVGRRVQHAMQADEVFLPIGTQDE